MILLIELLNGALVDTIALVDHVAGGGGIARVHVAIFVRVYDRF